MIDFTEKDPTTAELQRALGGEWTYDGNSNWLCNDGQRVVSRRSSIYDDETNHHPQFWLYGDGKPQQVIIFKEESDDGKD